MTLPISANSASNSSSSSSSDSSFSKAQTQPSNTAGLAQDTASGSGAPAGSPTSGPITPSPRNQNPDQYRSKDRTPVATGDLCDAWKSKDGPGDNSIGIKEQAKAASSDVVSNPIDYMASSSSSVSAPLSSAAFSSTVSTIVKTTVLPPPQTGSVQGAAGNSDIMDVDDTASAVSISAISTASSTAIAHSPASISASPPAAKNTVIKPQKRSEICQHNRHRRWCLDCGGKGICEHKKRRNRCIDCGGSGICEHKKRRDNCKLCKHLIQPRSPKKRKLAVAAASTFTTSRPLSYGDKGVERLESLLEYAKRHGSKSPQLGRAYSHPSPSTTALPAIRHQRVQEAATSSSQHYRYHPYHRRSDPSPHLKTPPTSIHDRRDDEFISSNNSYHHQVYSKHLPHQDFTHPINSVGYSIHDFNGHRSRSLLDLPSLHPLSNNPLQLPSLQVSSRSLDRSFIPTSPRRASLSDLHNIRSSPYSRAAETSFSHSHHETQDQISISSRKTSKTISQPASRNCSPIPLPSLAAGASMIKLPPLTGAPRSGFMATVLNTEDAGHHVRSKSSELFRHQ